MRSSRSCFVSDTAPLGLPCAALIVPVWRSGEVCPTPQVFDLFRDVGAVPGRLAATDGIAPRHCSFVLPTQVVVGGSVSCRHPVPVRHLVAIRVDPHDPIAAFGSHLLAGVMRLPGQPAIPHGETDAWRGSLADPFGSQTPSPRDALPPPN